MTRKLAVICGLLAVMLEPALADTPPAASKVTRIYDLVRNGSKIGTDTVDIEKNGATTTVKFTTHIAVVIAFVTVYKFEHTASETWNGNQFVSFTSQTNDNGTKHVVSAAVLGDKVHMEIDGKTSDAPRKAVPGSFWSRAVLASGDMFDEADGKLASIKVSDLGAETLNVNGVSHQTHHVRTVGGDLNRDLWFDGDVMVRLQLKGSDSSKIVSDLRQ